MANDYYLILQVARGASPGEIRSAYRRRALELHPDTAGTDSERFLELQAAYSVLSDPAQRAAYDQRADSIAVRRKEGITGRRRRVEPFREVELASGFGEVSLSESFGTFGPSFDELFERVWSNFDLLTRPKAERLESLNVDVPLTREEAWAGGSVRILVPARAICPTCGGHGAIGRYECWRCRGQGSLTAQYPVEVEYPAGLRRDHVIRLPLDDLGIHNFYLTVRFRPTMA